MIDTPPTLKDKPASVIPDIKPIVPPSVCVILKRVL